MKRSVPAAVLGALALGLAVLGLSSPAHARTCSSAEITVVVQFPNRTETRCSPSSAATGYRALELAGFDLSYARGSGAGAICGIDGYPRTECPAMPPANAYWAYFKGTPGAGWEYSSVGGGTSRPKAGTVEGWRFQDSNATKEPSTAPPGGSAAPVTAAPTKTPSAKPSRAPATAQGSAPTRGATPTPAESGGAASPTGTASSKATAKPGGARSSASEAPLPDPDDTPTGTPDAGSLAAQANPASLTGAESDSTSGSSWVWGLVLLGVLGAAAGGTAYKRRRS